MCRPQRGLDLKRMIVRHSGIQPVSRRSELRVSDNPILRKQTRLHYGTAGDCSAARDVEAAISAAKTGAGFSRDRCRNGKSGESVVRVERVRQVNEIAVCKIRSERCVVGYLFGTALRCAIDGSGSRQCQPHEDLVKEL